MPIDDRQRIDMGGEKPGMADAGEGIGRGRSGKKRCRGEDGQPEKTREKRSDGGRPQRSVLHQRLLREKNRRSTAERSMATRGMTVVPKENDHPTES
jgi:hypothetical protein